MTSSEAVAARVARLRAAADGKFDVAIVGGGVHGAFVALTAAMAGYSVLLLEQYDYASGTSSRSSKLLHGGVRYLEQKNFKLVFEALRERDFLLTLAPHLTRPLRFLFPVLPPLTPPAWQLSVGLGLYDTLSRFAPHAAEQLPRHRRHRDAQVFNALGLRATDGFSYSDAQVEDARLVVEVIVGASEQGAICLNHTRVEKIDAGTDGFRFRIRWRSSQPDVEAESLARVVFNCSGPWVENFASNNVMANNAANNNSANVVYSRGAHILFDVPWQHEALILPTGEQGRYYFVLPYFAPGSSSTLVGTTDRMTTVRDENPEATAAEIEELVGYIRRDMPGSPLDESRLYASFCGIRVLRSHGKDIDRVSSLSRSHKWENRDGIFSLYGGKYTTARSVAWEGVKQAARLCLTPRGAIAAVTQPVVGGVEYNFDRLLQLLSERFPETPVAERERAVQRFGSRVMAFPSGPGEHRLLAEQFKYAAVTEHALMTDDVLRRRLAVALLPSPVAKN